MLGARQGFPAHRRRRLDHVLVSHAVVDAPWHRPPPCQVGQSARCSHPADPSAASGAAGYRGRDTITEWLCVELTRPAPAIVGIDHAFSFPLPLLRGARADPNWLAFLDDFLRHWPTDQKSISVTHIRDGVSSLASERRGESTHLASPDRAAHQVS